MDRPYVKINFQRNGMNPEVHSIIETISEALVIAGYPDEKVQEFEEEATSCDYDNFMEVCEKWIEF